MTTTTDLEQAAVTLAEHGYHVFPCKPGDKTPLTSNGFKDATRDERKILHWWDQHPTANIGIACEASGIAVLDIDSKHGANPTEILDGSHPLNGAPIIFTGTAPERDHQHPRSLPGVRGAQVYFRGNLPTGDLPLIGCEIRGAGAYVIAPPSIHPSGIAYGPVGVPPVDQLPDVPDWLTRLVAASRSNIAPAAPIDETIIVGSRNNRLASLAGTFRNRGMDADEIETSLLAINKNRCRPPLDAAEVRAIAHGITRYQPQESINGTAIGTDEERFAVEIDNKGKLKLPAAPDRGDTSGQCRWLTAVFALDRRHPIISGARQGRGAEGHVVLQRLDTMAIRFEPASKINTPQRLVETLAWETLPTDEAVPPFKTEHCRQIAHVVRMLCGTTGTREAAQETAGIIGSYLSVAKEVHGQTTYGNGRERYAAAEALKRDVDEHTGRQVGAAKYLIDENTGELVMPLDELQSVARSYVGGSLPRGWLEARLEDLGWSRAVLDGHGLLGREGRSGPHNRRTVYRGHLPVENTEEA